MTSPEVRAAVEQIHAALDAADDGFHDRETGELDITSEQLAAALLEAGWTPPHPLVTAVNKLAADLAAEIAATQAEIERLQDAVREDPSVAEAVRQLEAAIEQARPPNIDAT